MRILTENDKITVLKRVLEGSSKRQEEWENYAQKGLSDTELEQFIKQILGIAGGSGCRDSIHVSYQGSGLKIWASCISQNPMHPLK
ncbi:hypothetical protein [Aquimarina macrocephali]|uniref:hypothetical protein n=1 Tax=Aquimarina macrocephali TaxID=666563 RepID=UPI0004643F19|nr:hypothetical protein [Aquimarina macrocephali]